MLKKSSLQDDNNSNNNKDTAAAQQSWFCGLISLKRQEVFGEWALSVPVDFDRVCGESVSFFHPSFLLFFSIPSLSFACFLTVLMIPELLIRV